MPATVVQAEDLNAFLCQLPASSGAIEWQINETSLCSVNAGEDRMIREGRVKQLKHLPSLPSLGLME